MDQETVDALNKEFPAVERMINAYLLSVGKLGKVVVHSMTFEEKKLVGVIKAADSDEVDRDDTIDGVAVAEEVVVSSTKNCKKCKDKSGKDVTFCGLGPCP